VGKFHESVVWGAHSILIHEPFSFSILFGCDAIHDFDKDTNELVDDSHGSSAVLKTRPNGFNIGIFARLLGDEFLVIESIPRRHGREQLVHAHFSHGSLREAHDRFKVFRLDIKVKFTVDEGD
jgi:hypothetical protein